MEMLERIVTIGAKIGIGFFEIDNPEGHGGMK